MGDGNWENGDFFIVGIVDIDRGLENELMRQISTSVKVGEFCPH